MELHEYTGKPSDAEIQQRFEFWQNWNPKGYKANHLRINNPCPCCDSTEDTEWVREDEEGVGWNICYRCRIAFTLEDSMPVYDPTNPPLELLMEYYEEALDE